jgi:disulfide bond formation protein DsbB
MGSTGKTAFCAASAILVVASSAIAGAWIVEALGFVPCELCLAQRWPYYLGLPLAALTAGLAWRGPGRLLTAAFFGLALVFEVSAILGAYHAGVEWGLWPGPSACTGALARAGSAEDFFAQLGSVEVVRCDAPALRLLGLSLAVWNAVVSIVLSVLAIIGMDGSRVGGTQQSIRGRFPL